jgi:hypothetical protein
MTSVSNPDLVFPDLTREFCGWNHGPRIVFHRSTFLAHIFCTLTYFDPQNASEKVGKNMPTHQFVLSARPYLYVFFECLATFCPNFILCGEKSCYIERPFRTAFPRPFHGLFDSRQRVGTLRLARYRGLQIESLRFRPFEASRPRCFRWSHGFAWTLAELIWTNYCYIYIYRYL